MRTHLWTIHHSLVWPAMSALLLLGACSPAQITDPTAPFYIPLPGSQVIVKQRLEVPPDQTRVFLQYGKIIPRKLLNEFAVNCNFEINTLAETPRYIEAGTYTVIHSQRDTDTIVQHGPIKLAARIQVMGSMQDSNGMSPMFEIIRLRLRGEKTADIRELACRGAIASPQDLEVPTLAEMQRALGEYAAIKPKGE